MKFDTDTALLMDESVAAKSYSAGNTEGATVDCYNLMSVSFFITAGTIGSSGTVDVKLQQSDDASTWTDVAAASGNDTAITQITAAGDARLDVVNVAHRYYRAYQTVATAACVVGIVHAGVKNTQ